jgi:hypothetical protein
MSLLILTFGSSVNRSAELLPDGMLRCLISLSATSASAGRVWTTRRESLFTTLDERLVVYRIPIMEIGSISDSIVR